ncbi:chromatin assembly factor 1 subunit A-like, partial [Benincasa hispida]|uniref:chromatin assembly factor 1 subunit A-like n=1 Tax=Benincasa hispida TaxID=102211 RepID=UPI0019003F59
MANQALQHSASPSTPSSDQIAMREAAFLAASRSLLSSRGGTTLKNTPVPTPVVSNESEKKRRDDKEVFGNILSHLEQGGGLPEVGVINQPLSTKEVTVVVTEEEAVAEEMVVAEAVVNEEETGRDTLTLETPEVTANAKTYDKPSRVVVEEIVVAEVAMEEVETQLEVVEEKKKKKKSKRRKAGEFVEEFEREEKEEEEEEKNKKEEEERRLKEEKEKKCEANRRCLQKKKGKELAEREKEEQRKEREKKQRQAARLALAKEKGKSIEKSSKPASVVRDFYRGRLHGTRDAVTLKRETVSFSARDINEIYQMKDNPYASGNKIIDDPTEQQMEDALQVLMQLGMKWSVSLKGVSTLASKSLLLEGRLWVYLVKKRLISTTHDKTVSRDRVMATYCIVRSIPIDVGQLIARQLRAL